MIFFLCSNLIIGGLVMGLKMFRQQLYDELPWKIEPNRKVCFYTGSPIYQSMVFDDVLSVDHVLPKALGGRDMFNNFVLVHHNVNLEKSDMRLRDYLEEIGQFHKFLKRLKRADISPQKKKHLKYCLYASY